MTCCVWTSSRKKEESEAMKNTDFKAHRWVVERTHSWMSRFRRVLTRWEEKVENYEAMSAFRLRHHCVEQDPIGIGSNKM